MEKNSTATTTEMQGFEIESYRRLFRKMDQLELLHRPPRLQALRVGPTCVRRRAVTGRRRRKVLLQTLSTARSTSRSCKRLCRSSPRLRIAKLIPATWLCNNKLHHLAARNGCHRATQQHGCAIASRITSQLAMAANVVVQQQAASSRSSQWLPSGYTATWLCNSKPHHLAARNGCHWATASTFFRHQHRHAMHATVSAQIPPESLQKSPRKLQRP